MTYGTILEVLNMLMEEAKRDKVAFHGTTAIEYLGNIQDYTGEGQREVYRIERRVE
ncbi:MAG: hypothetical protein J6V35_04190 [Bacteroidales bacterium]|nr:hypothetical protein [Bacteroidales bacterium]